MSRTITYDSQGNDITCMKEFDALKYPCKECNRECNRNDCEEKDKGEENNMNRVLTIEYEEFKDLGTKVMSIVDSEKDEVLNMFHGDEAEELYNKLITVVE